MDKAIVNIPYGSIVLNNLKRCTFKMYTEELAGQVTSLVTQDNTLLASLVGKGILMFSIFERKCKFVQHLHHTGTSPTSLAECKDTNITCHQLSVSAKYLIYIKDKLGKLTVCLHHYGDILGGKLTVKRELDILHRAPMVVDHELDMLCIGCSAWTGAWTTENNSSETQDINESFLRTVDLQTMEAVKTWKVVENAVYLLRLQITADHNMIGIADTRSGLSVYDLRQEESHQYICLYQVPAEEIRNFHLVGNFVAVFHKFQPNVTFWNMKEQKTILCINIQDQMRELVEEFLDVDEEECNLCEKDDDHVTSVTSVQSDEDHLLIYGTKSGCIFGMSVSKRLKLFNIPCPHLPTDSPTSTRHDVQSLQVMAGGMLVVVYGKCNLTLMDFSSEDPPERPFTRHQNRS